MDYKSLSTEPLPVQIARTIREAILTGQLGADDRLPSEAELSARFDVSRPTVREALKRLAAQKLIRTERGAAGGAFVHRISWEEAGRDMASDATLLISLHDIDFDTACEARFALEHSALPLACARRQEGHLTRMAAELDRQRMKGLSDEAFCASDVAFHRALVDAAGNPLLSWQLAGAVEGMQPLMNMVTYTARDRAEVIALHQRIADAVAAQNADDAAAALSALAAYTQALGQSARAKRRA
ncbi:DNA-binding FadR family transcriptional regulator [Rubricella aquisinus]|uniref:DNA-binding FadR family transcriptional regulator n=1 Tax=Rubricella aquisinus TaxID=2028108 RepID=A0A840X2Q4_9RHOB|nr:FCD domain-containing protein [Rubricella aquisinus]MBB5516145.1 DNA-binding FadR family transcriptional regulator [Rubricella aquisinus]